MGENVSCLVKLRFWLNVNHSNILRHLGLYACALNIVSLVNCMQIVLLSFYSLFYLEEL